MLNPFMTTLAVIALSAVAFMACSYPSNADRVVSSLNFSPSAFDSFKRNTELRYTLRRSARVSAIIVRRDSGEVLVKSLFSNLAETSGSHAHTWLGDNNGGQFVHAGQYVAVLTVDNERSEATVTVFHF